jgi:hypothetical protein
MGEDTIAASISFCLVCDDVRKEMSGKDTLVGVYSGDLVVETLPATLMIALYIGFTPSQTGLQQLRVRALFDETCVFEATATLNVEVNAAFCFGTPKMLIPCGGEGEIVFQAAIKDTGEWTDIQRKQVAVQAPPKMAPA